MTAPGLSLQGNRVGGLGIRSLLTGAAALSGAAIASSALSAVAGFAVARWLDPADYGRAQTVLLIYSLGSLVRSGIFEGGVRRSIELTALSRQDEARRVERVALWAETLVSATPGVLLVLWAPWVDDRLLRLGLLLAPIAILAPSISSFLGGLLLGQERFKVVARAGVVRGLTYPVVLVVLVQVFGALGIVATPIIADLVVIAWYVTRGKQSLTVPTFDRRLAGQLLRSGFPLGAGAIVYWLYRSAGSAAVALSASHSVYGLYAFAGGLVAVAARAVASIQTVLMPRLWRVMSADEGRDRGWAQDAGRSAVWIATIAALATNLAQAGFGPAVLLLVPRFAGSIRLFDLMAFNILLLSASAVPSLILDSPAVNQQVRHLFFWIVATAINIACNVVAFHLLDLGPIAIVVNDVWIQTVLVIVLFRAAERSVAPHWPGGFVHKRLFGIAIASACIGGVLHVSMPDSGSSLGMLLGHAAVRTLVVAGCWAGAAMLLRDGQRPITAAAVGGPT